MSTTVKELGEWFDLGVTLGATHMVVMCDTFDWEDYPLFVMPDQDARAIVEAKDGDNMQKVDGGLRLVDGQDGAVGGEARVQLLGGCSSLTTGDTRMSAQIAPIIDNIGSFVVYHGERGDLDPVHPAACLCGAPIYYLCDSRTSRHGRHHELGLSMSRTFLGVTGRNNDEHPAPDERPNAVQGGAVP